jgi:hypothetical protein
MNFIHKILRPSVDDNALYGYVLKVSDQLTLIAEEDDFILDGYKVIRNSDIDFCKPTSSTMYCTRIMKKENITLDPNISLQINLTNWATLFADLRKQDEFVIVENEFKDDFLIGPIRRVNKKSVTIDYFDGNGKWCAPQNISYADVTSVSFASRYIKMHRKYLK